MDMNEMKTKIVKHCNRLRDLLVTYDIPCNHCEISSICCNYDAYPGKCIDTWSESDISEASQILSDKYKVLRLMDVDAQKLELEDLEKFTKEDILEFIKAKDQAYEQLLEEIQYDYECSLGWDI